MQAIGNKIKANNPNAKIIYVSSENFMNEFGLLALILLPIACIKCVFPSPLLP